ncbi:phosphate ABC transporter substrate-binding protein, PhoT family [Actinacidiphila yanglinensis]|uniref:Phosphate ABC transporter substrate-binding protein, PhoT family n=1 Tax=Actinacidiphila yanglinensis TaxID=310779 RepID=A0A1H5W5F9_9ACTN|nr:phosphate ABC transporter substrate-binding protein PstS [Actinacidiphila yanglinensis]SEF94660.1 phosphate ABC transporter substrate-binding protein, PhoT family [Actinacidiphila yanglinensis]
MRRIRAAAAALGLLICSLLVLGQQGPSASAATYARISGAGSTWSQNAIDQWRRNVTQYGMTIDYAGTGSSDGRQQFRNGTVDFGVSEIPYGMTEFGVREPPPTRGYAYMPIVAGGTAFMYNLQIGGKRVTNLRLNGDTVSRIFTGKITNWSDKAIAADNPGLTLPNRKIIPVVRSDGSGTTAQFSLWMSKEHGSVWNDYCRRVGKPVPCGLTSYFPVVPGSGFISQSGSLGVSGYTRQNYANGAITYVEYSYAVTTGFPVAKIENSDGYYTEPTASNVAVALTQAQINQNKSSSQYLTQILDNVYHYKDPRTYPLSSYSYMILPTKVEKGFTTDKGNTLGAFGYYFLCEGQRQAEPLGFSPLPINLVQAGFDQLKRIPGVQVQSINLKGCDNPTFSTNGTNTLAKNAPFPKSCDKAGPTQCSDGTGGASHVKTPVKSSAGGGTGGSSAGTAGSGSGTTAGSSGTGSGTTAGSGSTSGAGSGTTTAGATSAGTSGGVDPDTGLSTGDAGGSGDGGQDIAASTVSVGSESFWGLRTWLMGLSALLLLAVVVAPPTIARRLTTRTGKRHGSA